MWGRKSLPASIDHPQAGLITIKIHPQSKRMRLSFRAPACFSMTVPPGTSERALQQFIAQTEGWILRQLSKVATLESSIQNQFLFQGVPYEIVSQSILSRELYQINHHQKVIIVDAIGVSSTQRLRYVCRKEFQQLLPPLIDKYSKAMGLFPKKISIRDTKSRWGSCSSAGNISLSWRLVMAPFEVMEYIIIHELAHLKHLDHSQAFWSLVSQYCPDYNQHRYWLKINAQQLHYI
ncbi:MAG: M48 family metallopeptidase [Candidatus Paracaedibacteraceae bacterium]|nr:M48 family metallopeptidase [Candidatus Paracaedibacteraceae bacterium]